MIIFVYSLSNSTQYLVKTFIVVSELKYLILKYFNFLKFLNFALILERLNLIRIC